jgi:molecular chaperone GrpE
MNEEMKKEEQLAENINNEEIVEDIEQTEEIVEEAEEQESSDLMSEEGRANFKSKMESKVQEAEDKAKESEDKYLRAYAEFENIKKRLEREKYQAIDYSSEKFAKDLLAPIDALQMAVLSVQGDLPPETIVEKLKEGIELTLKSFNTAFEKHDISEVQYDEFNPEHHNAVMQVDSEEVESGQIVTVMQKGYQLKERLLREAMVSVAN